MKKDVGLIGGIVALLFLFGVAHATTWYVHPDSTLNSIQAGIGFCSTGDTVLVGPGTYIENINFNGMAITVTSELGPDTTVIDGGTPANPDTGSVVIFNSGEDSSSVLNGFTITNGTGTLDTIFWIYNGGGIFCFNNSSPTITDNVITENRAWWAGGIDCWSSSPIIMGNTISNNIADTARGGIECYDNSHPLIDSNTITGNTAIWGGGISPAHDCSPTITNNIITHNYAYYSGGGISTAYNSPSIITGNIIDSNTAMWGGGIFCAGEIPPNVSYIANNTIRNNTAYYGGGIDCNEIASPEIHNNIITGNTATIGGGIRCNNNSSPIIDSCAILNNIGDGIYCVGGSNPVINYNNINNPGYGVRNMSSWITVDAEYNWWGDATGPYHPTANPGGLGNAVSDYVDFAPWDTVPYPWGIEEYNPSEPFVIALQISPNPFRDKVSITFSMEYNIEAMAFTIYDATGRVVKEFNHLTNNQIFWNGTDNLNRRLSSGVYFLKFKAGDYSATEKLLLIR